MKRSVIEVLPHLRNFFYAYLCNLKQAKSTNRQLMVFLKILFFLLSGGHETVES